MATARRRTIISGLVALVGASLLAGCSIVNPIPFSTAAPSPAAESAQAPGVRAAGTEFPFAERVGIAAGSAILWDSDADRNQQLDLIQASGARWFSMDIDWNSIQNGGPKSFWWVATDRLAAAAHARGLKVIGMIGYSPTWARPANCPPNTDKCLPANPSDFANIARAAVRRYGATSNIPSLRGSISAWQIWNEPNHYPFVQPVVDAAAYTRMLKRAYVNMKQVDPTAIVLAGGTSPAPDDPNGQQMAPVTFLKRIYAYGGKGYFDAFAHHPYSFPCNPLTNAAWNAFTQTSYLHDLMVQKGDGAKKIWGTEAGAPTANDVGACTPNNPGRSVSEATQSQFVADYFKGWYGDFGSFTGPLIWFQIRDNGTDPGYYDDHFGLVRRNFEEKPAYRTFKRLVQGNGFLG